MKRSLLLCLISGLSVGASPALAQHSQTRQGFWFNVGLGYGSLGCQGCSGRTGGLSGGLSLGGTLTPKLLLGVGTTGWRKSENGATLTVGTLDARVRYYPSATGGFLLTGRRDLPPLRGAAASLDRSRRAPGSRNGTCARSAADTSRGSHAGTELRSHCRAYAVAGRLPGSGALRCTGVRFRGIGTAERPRDRAGAVHRRVR